MNDLLKEPLIVTSFPLRWLRLRLAAKTTEAAPPLPSPLPVWDDAQLVQRLAIGEPDALALIYDRYAASLYRVLNALLSSGADAEDALQEVFLALATARVSRIRNLKSYLFVAARHHAINQLRRRKRERGYEDIDTLEVADPSYAAPNTDYARLLARLPLEQREVIALKVWEEMTFAEIAKVVRASPNTVMSRYRYGIERLRTWCREEDLD
jgi:RNA polymerase sigma-70 factor (ECF subfamily)